MGSTPLTIDEYLRERLMPVEGAIRCHALLEFVVSNDDDLLQAGEEDLIEDKTVFIIKEG